MAALLQKSKKLISGGGKLVSNGMDMIANTIADPVKHQWCPDSDDDLKQPGSNKQSNKSDNEDMKQTQNDIQQTKEGDSTVAIVVIGNCGTGKSSIIKLLSGRDVKISSGSERGTHEVSTIQSKYDKNIFFIDTIGLQDSNKDWTDDKLLKRTLQYIHHEGFTEIKVIFCVSGDTKTRQGPFCRPAAFIGILKVRDDNDVSKSEALCNPTDDGDDEKKETPTTPDIWESVLIIKKEGEPEDISDVSGVLDAAIANGATQYIKNDKYVFGFTCTESTWNFKPDKWYRKLSEDEYEEFGYFTALRAKEIINKKLNNLPSFELKFNHEICSKCGAKGDSRYVVAACHTKSGYFHDKPLESYHSGYQEAKHTGVLSECIVTTGYYHAGFKKTPHREQKEKYHSGKIKTGFITAVAGSIFKLTKRDFWRPQEWKWWSCCNEWIGEATPCAERWKCCEAPPSSTECTAAYARKIWSCCNKGAYSDGCMERKGKAQKYLCCDKPEGDTGCELFWSCCEEPGKPKQEKGCKLKHPCCNGEAGSKGCKRKCVNCKKEWGKPNGCVAAE